MNEELPSLETRVARLEGKLGWRDVPREFSSERVLWSLVVLCAGCGACFLSLGLPNHLYQGVFGVLLIALAYHQEWLLLPAGVMRWVLAGLNVFSLSMLLKLLVGSGKVQPLFWVRYPMIASSGQGAEQKNWYQVMPDLSVVWEESAVSGMTVDLTVVQTFLLLVTMVGALFEFQPFASLTALLLIAVSLPALASFDWTWMMPAIVLIAISLYLQTGTERPLLSSGSPQPS